VNGMDEVKYGGGLTAEERLARLEQRLGVGILAPTANGSVLSADDTQPGLVAWKDPASRFKVGSFSVPGSTGNHSVTGLGFKPGLVVITGGWIAITNTNLASHGAMDGSGNQWAQSNWSDVGNIHGTHRDTAACMLLCIPAGTVVVRAEYVSMDADGFTINFTAVNPSSRVSWVAYA
jgi:hypothetical protein